jgi:hypothetical protein
MMARKPELPLFVIRYQCNRDLVDVTSRGNTGEEAFQHYLDELIKQGKDVGAYQFISGSPMSLPED